MSPESEALDTEDTVSNPSNNESFQEVWQRRISRRTILRGAAAAGPLLVLGTSIVACDDDDKGGQAVQTPIGFTSVPPNNEDRVTVPAGYEAQVVIRWGDPLMETGAVTPAQITSMTAAEQQARFGYENDWVGFFPLKDYGSKNSNLGLLGVNHENVLPALMFPNFDAANPTKAQVDVEMAAHGLTVVEVGKDKAGKWSYKAGSSYNRRIHVDTPMEITGPAAGNEKLKTSTEPTGTKVNGMLNNCGGGKTPWGTILTCEENFNGYFANMNSMPDSDPRKAMHRRYGLTAGASVLGWEKFYNRFDLTKEPNEPFRFGWVVEIDPYDSKSTPKKRTALGRLKHEAATVVTSTDGRAVIYTGDDERFDYVYKFVTADKINTKDAKANANILDKGTLYVAKFMDSGAGEWIPLVFGQGALTAANGFASQADVLISTRQAADAVGATKMDRPEDIETSPVTGKVYMAMTNNTNRTAEQIDRANPRAANKHGHIVELTETGGDNGALTFRWEMFIQAGDPKVAADNTYFAGFDQTKVSWLSCPDNLCFDGGGNLWITTDGAPGTIKTADAVYVAPTEGPERGYLRTFLTGPIGAELTGPEFTPDYTTFFAAIQHPGEGTGSTLETPLSKFPDGSSPPRASIVAVVKTAKEGPRTVGS